MAEVSVWTEEDGLRITYTVENADELRAVQRAQGFIETLGDREFAPYGAYVATGFDVKSSNTLRFRIWFYER